MSANSMNSTFEFSSSKGREISAKFFTIAFHLGRRMTANSMVLPQFSTEPTCSPYQRLDLASLHISACLCMLFGNFGSPGSRSLSTQRSGGYFGYLSHYNT